MRIYIRFINRTCIVTDGLRDTNNIELLFGITQFPSVFPLSGETYRMYILALVQFGIPCLLFLPSFLSFLFQSREFRCVVNRERYIER